MKKIWILLIGLGIVGCAMDDSTSMQLIHKKVSVLDKGIIRNINVSYTKEEQSQIENKGFIIKFDKAMSEEEIKTFENTNGLKLKKKLHSGYYIFEKTTQSSMFEVLDNFIKHPQHISTVRPNIKLQMKPY